MKKPENLLDYILENYKMISKEDANLIVENYNKLKFAEKNISIDTFITTILKEHFMKKP